MRLNSTVNLSKICQYAVKELVKQECIPVRCIPPAHWPYPGGCLPGGCLPRGVSAQWVSAQAGVCPEGVVCPGGCLPRGVVCPGGLSAQGGCLLGVSVQGPSAQGVSCDLSHHEFNVTCMLSFHQLRLITSAAAYIVFSHVTCDACWDTHTHPCGQNDRHV